MENLPENEGFVTGIAVGIYIHQQRVLAAHGREEPLEINGETYFIQSGREILGQVIDEICK